MLNEVKHKIMSLNIKENKKEKMLNRNFICDRATTTNKQIDSLSELTKSLIVTKAQYRLMILIKILKFKTN